MSAYVMISVSGKGQSVSRRYVLIRLHACRLCIYGNIILNNPFRSPLFLRSHSPVIVLYHLLISWKLNILLLIIVFLQITVCICGGKHKNRSYSIDLSFVLIFCLSRLKQDHARNTFSDFTRIQEILVPKSLGPRTKSFLKNKQLQTEEVAFNIIKFPV